MLDPPGDRYVDIKMKDDLNKILKDHLSGKAHAYLFFVGLMYICFFIQRNCQDYSHSTKKPEAAHTI